jgi:hypothetical protein
MILIDGIGALISAIMLGIILVKIQYLIGMPVSILYLLASIPCVYLVYDLISFSFRNTNHKLLLKVVAYANLGYTVVSAGLVIGHLQQLQLLGLVYFISEITILIVLIRIELRIASSKAFD